jgi:hypothetical protein
MSEDRKGEKNAFYGRTHDEETKQKIGQKNKEKMKTEWELNNPVQIKMFNILFKKDAPFNYNMKSNNGWLEVFVWGKN